MLGNTALYNISTIARITKQDWGLLDHRRLRQCPNQK